MRRSDREVTEFSEIVEILTRCDTVRIGFKGEEYPYVVPLSFGFEVLDGQICIYLHGARNGLRHQLAQQSNRVCVEADICHRYWQRSGDYGTQYESVIGFGQIQPLEGAEAVHALNCIMAHCGFAGEPWAESILPKTAVESIVLTEVFGKRRPE